MRWGSLILGLILLIPNVSVFAVRGAMGNLSVIGTLPVIGPIVEALLRIALGINPFITLGIAAIGLILVINGFRPVPTKLSIKDIQRLGLDRSRTAVVPPEQSDVEELLKILRLRLAKGEITKEEYEELKKTLEGSPQTSTVPSSAKQVPTAIPSVKQVPKKMSRLSIVAVVVLIFTVTIGTLYYLGVFDELFGLTALTPARDLEGTWKTAFAVKFYIRSDFIVGDFQEIGSEDRMMTWVITATSDENVVDVVVYFTESNLQLTEPVYVPDISPKVLKGYISGARLTLVVPPYEPIGPPITQLNDGIIGEFSFISDNIQGTWDDYWEQSGDHQEVYTATGTLILNKE